MFYKVVIHVHNNSPYMDKQKNKYVQLTNLIYNNHLKFQFNGSLNFKYAYKGT